MSKIGDFAIHHSAILGEDVLLPSFRQRKRRSS
jgi:hypothetical protein